MLFFVFGVGFATWASRLPAIEHKAHLNNAQLGIALLGQPVGQFLATLVTPNIVARLSSASTARIAAITSCLALVVLGTADSLLGLIGGLLLYGATLGTLDITMNTQGIAVQRLYGRSILSGIHAVYNIGVLVGSLAGALAAALGLRPLLHFVIVAGLLILLAASTTRRLLGAEADETIGDDRSVRTGHPRLLSHPILIAIGMIGFCAYFVEGAPENWGSVFLHQVRHAALGVAPLGTAAYGIGMTVGRMSGDALISRRGLLPTVLGSTALAAAGVMLALLGGTIPTTLIGFAVLGLGIATIVPIVITIGGSVRGVSPGWSVSRVVAMSYAGQTTSPAIIGLVARAASLSWAMATTLLFLLAIAPLSRIARRGVDPSNGP